MGYSDDLKVLSCMTLFNVADPSIEIFKKVLDKFYDGDCDKITLDIIDCSNSPTWADAFIYKSRVNLAKKSFLSGHIFLSFLELKLIGVYTSGFAALRL